jgi:hypothetical protein
MSQATGSNSKLIYDQEASFGVTPGTPAAIVAYFKDEGFSQTVEQISSNIIRGNRNPTMPFTGNRSVKGSLSSELAPFGQAALLKHLLGTVTTSGTTNFTHVFKIGTLPTSLCFEKQFLDLGKYFLYNGCRIGKASFDFKPAGPIDVSFDFVGRQETIASASFDAAPTDLGHSPFEGFQSAILEGGNSIGAVTALKFDVDNDLQSDLYTIGGGGLVSSLPAGVVKVTGSATVVFDSITLYEKAVAGTESSLKVTLTKGTGDGSAGNEELELLVPELRFQASTPLIKDSKGIMLEMPFEAYYTNSTEATAIQITLKNTQATV